jgi:hypothetical protein
MVSNLMQQMGDNEADGNYTDANVTNASTNAVDGI